MIKPQQRRYLGTFGGVFTPSILAIICVILFLRLGYITGAGGILQTIAIIVLANTITLLSTISLAAAATNIHVRGGGFYYIISRTLGAEWGGVIGIVIFLAIALSIGFYCIGAGEIIAPLLFPDHPQATQWVAGAVALLLFGVAWMGAVFSTRFQYIVMLVLFVAFLSFFAGALPQASWHRLAATWAPLENAPGFWLLFALFFPAVTGFHEGVNMSGDLKEPARSIVSGTFWATGLSFGIYLIIAIVLAASAPRDALLSDFHIFEHLALSEELATAGIAAAAISSALACLLGAPRVLQAMGKDALFPGVGVFARGEGNEDNPRRALIVAGLVTSGAIAIGELNQVATLVTIFFLLSYGVLNYATFQEAYAESPSFRPALKIYNKWFSFAGVLLCLLATIAVDPVAGAVAAFLMLLLYRFVMNSAPDSNRWEDNTRSFKTKLVRDLLFEIEARKEYPHDWRPHVLAFLPENHHEWPDILYFASCVVGKSGTLTAVHILEGKNVLRERDSGQREIIQAIEDTGIEAFPLALIAPSFKEALSVLLQSYGLGPIHANTVLLDWPIEEMDERTRLQFAERLHTALSFNENLVVLKTEKDSWRALEHGEQLPQRIDIWWGDDKTSRLMLMLAFLTTRTPRWGAVTIRILAQSHKEHKQLTRLDLEQLLQKSRIDADIELLPEIDTHVISKHSADASLVFMPMKLLGNVPADYLGEPIDDPLFSILNIALVIAGEDVDLSSDSDY
jgi:amino acid transporter